MLKADERFLHRSLWNPKSNSIWRSLNNLKRRGAVIVQAPTKRARRGCTPPIGLLKHVSYHARAFLECQLGCDLSSRTRLAPSLRDCMQSTH